MEEIYGCGIPVEIKSLNYYMCDVFNRLYSDNKLLQAYHILIIGITNSDCVFGHTHTNQVIQRTLLKFVYNRKTSWLIH